MDSKIGGVGKSTYSGHGTLEKRLVGDERFVIVEPNHKIALERAVLILGILKACCLLLELSQRFHFEIFDSYSNVFCALVAKSGKGGEARFVAAGID